MNTGDKKIRERCIGWKAANGFTIPDAAKRLKLAERTFSRKMDEPDTLTLAEFRKIVDVLNVGPEEVWQMVTGRRRA